MGNVTLYVATLLLHTTVTYKQLLQANSSNQKDKKTESVIACHTLYRYLSYVSKNNSSASQKG